MLIGLVIKSDIELIKIVIGMNLNVDYRFMVNV